MSKLFSIEITLNDIYNADTDQAAFSACVGREFVFMYIQSETNSVNIGFYARQVGKCGYEFNVWKVVYNGKDLADAFPRSLNR